MTKTQLTGASIVTAAFLSRSVADHFLHRRSNRKIRGGDWRSLLAVPPIPNRGCAADAVWQGVRRQQLQADGD